MSLRVDVGCGAGRCEDGWIGVDLDPRYGQVHAPADCLPWEDGTVDEVFSSHLLEHVPDAAAALREWRRVLRPGGKLTVRVPNLPAWVERWLASAPPERWEWPLTEWCFQWESEGLMRHRTGFDAERLKRMVQAAGFDVLSVAVTRSRAEHGPEYHPTGDLVCEAVRR